MKINVVAVGRLKEKYLSDSQKEYEKRIGRYHKINIIEIDEEKLPKLPNEADISKALIRESARIDKYLSGFVIVLDKDGLDMTSIDFAQKIDATSQNFDTITFVIGGSYGLSQDLKLRANMSLSFSKMTFPHQLFRTMLLEQIYRACTISNNICYHK